ncbi:MAG TPA: hypothetical protein VMN81_06600 [Vicinamibacterales bacterium]|nr:hypothetical protein [Vicinamibacterales bacterium]
MRRMQVISMAALTAVLTTAALGYSGYTSAAQARFDAAALIKGYDTYRQMRDTSPTAGVPWRYIGPANVSGRATDVAIADTDGRRTLYVGYATSGVWKSGDDGATWTDIFEHMPTASIGDVAVAPSQPDTVWVGTGEANLFRASLAGLGIYKSTDAGRTWQHMGLAETHTIARIVVHPTNPDIVYVAATGHGWTDNPERGIFKTTDGGRTWTKIFYKSDRTGANDLVMDPTNPDVLYASLWQRIRRKWSDPRVEPGYSEGGIIKSTDGGKTWADASSGLPTPQYRGRIGIDIARSSPNILYAFIDNYEIGREPQPNERDAYGRPITNARIKGAQVYRSDDRGASWRQANAADMINHSQTYGWVFGQIRVDPTNPDVVYTMGIALNRSTDGGRTFAAVNGPSVDSVTGAGTGRVHVDHHGLWIDPADPLKLYNANDGGFYRSADGGKTWTFAQTAGGAQFYNAALDNSTPIWAYGSIQDHGSRRGQVILSEGRDTIPAVRWENAPGGEGSHHAIDPNNQIVYTHGFYGNFSRTDLAEQAKARAAAAAAGQPAGRGRGAPGVTNIQPMRDDPEAELRAQWMAPIIVSQHGGNVIYAGYQYLFRSANRGDSWDRISPDLTEGDQEQMLPKHSSAIPYQTIVAIAESPAKASLLYAGTDDGKLHVTTDMGKTWTDLTSRLPVRRWISRIVASQHDEATVYVTQQGRSDDDFAPYIWKSTDGGRTFTSIVSNIPAGPVNVIREDPRDTNTLYVGTDHGVYFSRDAGKRWNVLGGGLPSAQVSDLQVHGRDNIIVISTYGRGMWALDLLKTR